MDSGILLVYFSQTGKTREIANLISRVTGCDVERIRPVIPYTGTAAAIRQQLLSQGNSINPKIEPPVHDITSYGTVILGMPVWENDIPAPVRTYIGDIDWRGIRVHPYFSSGGMFQGIYHSLCSSLKGAAVTDPLYLIYDDCGNFLRAVE